MIHIYVTYPKPSEAKRISNLILKKRLAACIDFFPVTTRYWWQGKIVNGKEIVTFIATQKNYYKSIETLIKKHHSYKVPCILELPILRVYKKYDKWLKNETKSKG